MLCKAASTNSSPNKGLFTATVLVGLLLALDVPSVVAACEQWCPQNNVTPPRPPPLHPCMGLLFSGLCRSPDPSWTGVWLPAVGESMFLRQRSASPSLSRRGWNLPTNSGKPGAGTLTPGNCRVQTYPRASPDRIPKPRSAFSGAWGAAAMLPGPDLAQTCSSGPLGPPLLRTGAPKGPAPRPCHTARSLHWQKMSIGCL